MRTLLQDLRYGFRAMLKSPVLTLVAVLTLALGIGANSAIFSVVNAVLLRPMPYPEPGRLVRVGGSNPKTGVQIGTFSPPDFYDWRERNSVFEGVAAIDGWSASLTGAGEPERVSAARVSANFFGLLRVNPVLGRAFLPQEEQRGNHLVVVLSHGLWQRRFGSDGGVVGQTVTLNGYAYTVVGVMPPGFEPPRFTGGDFERPELWAPFAPDLSQWGRGGRSVDAAIARLKPGVSLEQARAEMSAIGRRLQEQYPETNTNNGVGVASLHEQLVGGVRTPLLVFLAAVGFVLLIACANVANLLLARAASRRREMAIRAALGASRRRIVRQVLTESLLLSFLGAGAGLLLALWATDFLVALGSDSIPRLGAISIDARVLGFTLAVAVLTGVVFGLAPALQSARPDLGDALKEGGGKGAVGARRSRLRGALVVSEVALSLVLLVGAGLLVKSFALLRQVNPGFDPKNVLTMYVFLPGAKYPEDEQHAAFFEEAATRIAALPGVEAVGVTSNLPVSGNYDRLGFYVEDAPEPAREDVPEIERYVVNAEYFRAMGIPVLDGRAFGAEDVADALPAVIINETAARKYWPGGGAVGRRVRTDPEGPWRTVVGVVGDVRHYGLETAPNMQMYLPHRQNPSQVMTFVVRGATDPETLAAPVRGEIWSVDKDQPVYNVRVMEGLLADSLAQRRFTMLLLGIFAAVAALLAVVGIYGVVSYSVTQRTREIGVRVALGARPWDVFRLVIGQGMLTSLAGTGLGLLASLALTRVMASLLFGVTATDPSTYVGVSALLLAAALLACYVPARRATKVDPMTALRYE